MARSSSNGWPTDFGQSAPATTGDYAIRTHADDLARVTEAVLEHTGGPSPVHVGFSMGVTVALELYRARPELVGALILLGGPADAPYATSFPLRLPGVLPLVRRGLAMLEPLALWGAPAFHALATSRLAYPLARTLGIVEKTAPREDIEGMALALTRMDARAFWSSMVSLMGAHASDVLPTVHVPTLVIGAAHDKFVPKKQIPAARLAPARRRDLDDRARGARDPRRSRPRGGRRDPTVPRVARERHTFVARAIVKCWRTALSSKYSPMSASNSVRSAARRSG